jgi:hypothetical protein
VELELEHTVVGRPEDMVPPAEVDGGPTAAMEGDNAAGLSEGCRLGGTWAECLYNGELTSTGVHHLLEVSGII